MDGGWIRGYMVEVSGVEYSYFCEYYFDCIFRAKTEVVTGVTGLDMG